MTMKQVMEDLGSRLRSGRNVYVVSREGASDMTDSYKLLTSPKVS